MYFQASERLILNNVDLGIALCLSFQFVSAKHGYMFRAKDLKENLIFYNFYNADLKPDHYVPSNLSKSDIFPTLTSNTIDIGIRYPFVNRRRIMLSKILQPVFK